MPLLDTGLGGLYYETAGDGPPLLMLHGLACDLAQWECQVPELSKTFQLILLDNRGTGRTTAKVPALTGTLSSIRGVAQDTVSDTPRDMAKVPASSEVPGILAAPAGALVQGLTTRNMAADAAAVLDHLGIASCDVLGYSMGAQIAQWLALDRQELVSRLVLAAGTGRFPARQRMLFRGWEKLFREGTSLAAFLDMVLPWTFGNAFLEDPASCELAMQRLIQRRFPQQLEGYIAQTGAVLEHDTRSLAGRIAQPTLLLTGEDDLLVTPSQSRALAASMPNARLQIISSCGHQLPLEKPEEFNTAVTAFLTDG